MELTGNSATELVYESYGRCVTKPGFFDHFYDTFFNSSPEIGPKFARTDMFKQKLLLKNGISFMIMFAKDSPIAAAKLDKLAATHAKSQLNIEPRFYGHWLRSLVSTVEKFDPKFSADLGKAWQRVMEKGITFFNDRYAA